MEAEPIAQVSISNLYWSSAPLVSTPTTTLVLRGRTTVVKKESGSSSPTAYTRINVPGLTGAARPSCDLDGIWDQPPSTATLLELALLRSRHTEEDKASPGDCVALVLSPDCSPGMHRRIGVTSISHEVYSDQFHSAEEQSLSLV